MDEIQLRSLTQKIEQLETKLNNQTRIIEKLVSKKINVHEELASRGFVMTENNLQRCTKIIKEYRGLTFKELREVLDAMSAVNDETDIKDVPAFLYSALRRKYWHKHQDYNPQLDPQ